MLPFLRKRVLALGRLPAPTAKDLGCFSRYLVQPWHLLPSTRALQHNARASYRAWTAPQVPIQHSNYCCTQATTEAVQEEPADGGTEIKVPSEIAPGITLRDYQAVIIEDILENIKAGLVRQLVSLPTGSGKTVVFLALARLLNLRTLILVNSRELVEQTEAKLQQIWPGVWFGLMQEKKNMFDRHVVIATVQTASSPKRLESLATQNFQLLIVDEAHHSTANSYVAVMLNLGFVTSKDAVDVTGQEWLKAEDGSQEGSEIWRLETKEEKKRKQECSQCSSSTNNDLAKESSEMKSSSIVAEGESSNSSSSSGSSSSRSNEPSLSIAGSSCADGDKGPEDSSTCLSSAGGSLADGSRGLSVSSKSNAPVNGIDSSTSCTADSDHSAGGKGPRDSSTFLRRASSSHDGDSKGLDKSSNTDNNILCFNGMGSSSTEGLSKLISSSRSKGQKIIIGCTATPYRMGPDKLSMVYETLVRAISLGDLIREGHLCKVHAERILTYTDISNAQTYTGTLLDTELSQAVDTPERNQLVVSAYLEKAKGRKAVAFCCNVEHALHLAAAFREQGVSAENVDSKSMHPSARLRRLEAHRRGEIQVLTNVGVLTEGYDDTSISCILMTKPTTSTGLYTQCVGRGLRTHPAKEDCVLLDFTDRLHSLDRESDLVTSEDVFKGEEGVTLHNYDHEGKKEMALELRNIMGGQFSLYQQQEFYWIPRYNEFWMSVIVGECSPYLRKRGGRPPRKNVWVHLKQVPPPDPPSDQSQGSRKRHRLYYQLCVSQPSHNPPIGMPDEWEVVADIPRVFNPSQALERAEKALKSLSRTEKVPDLKPMRLARWNGKVSWHSEPASSKQIEFLARNRWLPDDYDPDRFTKGQAATIITLLKIDQASRRAVTQAAEGPSFPATDRQKAYLMFLLGRFGHLPFVQLALQGADLPTGSEEVQRLTKFEAGSAISIINLYTREQQPENAGPQFG